ncbi:hypothetical protein BC830DRAFT_1081028 [Chytriomyces sp. MP71]|nr:hypothetical protein BC830DRAFT_1081028 [Chytriomyces sp. MP71]
MMDGGGEGVIESCSVVDVLKVALSTGDGAVGRTGEAAYFDQTCLDVNEGSRGQGVKDNNTSDKGFVVESRVDENRTMPVHSSTPLERVSGVCAPACEDKEAAGCVKLERVAAKLEARAGGERDVVGEARRWQGESAWLCGRGQEEKAVEEDTRCGIARGRCPKAGQCVQSTSQDQSLDPKRARRDGR